MGEEILNYYTEEIGETILLTLKKMEFGYLAIHYML